MNLEALLGGTSMSQQEAEATMDAILGGSMAPEALAGFLVAMRAKGVTAAELVGFASAMREHSLRIETEGIILDNCGTGGATNKTVNVSTVAAFVLAAGGVRVAKHGNRSITRPSGSADLLESGGANLDLPPARIKQILDEMGIAFLFAPAFHPAMKHAGPVRQALGIPTLFNLLGPLTNPAGASHQVIGVGNPQHVRVIADAIGGLGCARALVFHGAGYDEITPTGQAHGFLVQAGKDPEPWSWMPPVAPCQPQDIAPLAREKALPRMLGVLEGAEGPIADTVALNAAAGFWIAGRASSPEEGLTLAQEILASGAGKDKWDTFVAATNA